MLVRPESNSRPPAWQPGRGLKFAFPQKLSPKDQVSFEQVYWKDLASATLCSIALNYINMKSPSTPKSLVCALNKLKKRDDIVVTSLIRVRVLSSWTRLIIYDYLAMLQLPTQAKFVKVSCQPPKARGRPPKYYHPLLQKEKKLNETIKRILPKTVPDTVCRKVSRLAHLYVLPKTHKPTLSMSPILLATGTYNFSLVKWLVTKLKPLSVNKFGNLVPRSPTVIRKGDLVKFDFEHAQCQRGLKYGLFYHCACSYSLL